jgi:hypothetical protein
VAGPHQSLGLLGVGITDLGAPCQSEFRSLRGKTRVRVKLPGHVIRDFGGGFTGLLRPDLYERLLAALLSGILGADGINSLVRRTL